MAADADELGVGFGMGFATVVAGGGAVVEAASSSPSASDACRRATNSAFLPVCGRLRAFKSSSSSAFFFFE